MRKSFIAAAIALGAVLASSGVVLAYETGIAVIHPWVKVGRKICFEDHYHYGSGSGPTQKQAQADAINSWEWPTGLEYGSSWGDYRLAVGKSMKCTRSGAVWSCDTQARPCLQD